MIHIIIQLLIALLIITSSANAYWVETKPAPRTIPSIRETAPKSSPKGFFTIQDNFNIFSSEDYNKHIILPHSNYFIPADIINMNIPIFSMFTQPTKTTNDPIANLLYANLKIKTLLEDYIRLKEKAKKYLDFRYEALSSGKMKIPDNFYAHREHNQLSTRLSTINNANAEPQQAFPTKSAVDFSKANHIIMLQHLENITKKGTINSQRIGYSSQTIKDNEQPNNRQDHRQDNNFQHSNASKEGNHNKSLSKKISLPWLLQLPDKIFNFFLSNKTTTLVIGLFFLMIASIFIGSKY